MGWLSYGQKIQGKYSHQSNLESSMMHFVQVQQSLDASGSREEARLKSKLS
jgi:hypothetical protein